MSAGLALGLIASLAWGLVDITGALASRRLGSLRVLAGSQIVSLIALVGIVIVERSRLGDGAIEGVAGRAAAGRRRRRSRTCATSRRCGSGR